VFGFRELALKMGSRFMARRQAGGATQRHGRDDSRRAEEPVLRRRRVVARSAHRSHKKRFASLFSDSRFHMFYYWPAVNWFPALRFLASSELIGLAPAKSEAF
jgi:hypothetical protein